MPFCGMKWYISEMELSMVLHWTDWSAPIHFSSLFSNVDDRVPEQKISHFPASTQPKSSTWWWKVQKKKTSRSISSHIKETNCNFFCTFVLVPYGHFDRLLSWRTWLTKVGDFSHFQPGCRKKKKITRFTSPPSSGQVERQKSDWMDGWGAINTPRKKKRNFIYSRLSHTFSKNWQRLLRYPIADVIFSFFLDFFFLQILVVKVNQDPPIRAAMYRSRHLRITQFWSMEREARINLISPISDTLCALTMAIVDVPTIGEHCSSIDNRQQWTRGVLWRLSQG